MGDSSGIPLPLRRSLTANISASEGGKRNSRFPSSLRTSIRLQTAFDRCFSQFGMTAQEAAVLVHCSEEGETSAGRLAKVMGRDKGKITRFVDRLETGGFLTRRNDARDHRLLIIKATGKGRRFAPQLKTRFEEVRNQFFEGVLNVDIDKLEAVLTQLHANAERLCEGKASQRRTGFGAGEGRDPFQGWGWARMNGICASAPAFPWKPALRTVLATVLLCSSPFLFSTHLYATSVVALIDRANQRLVIAADCRVNRGAFFWRRLDLQNHSGTGLHGSHGGPLRGKELWLSVEGIYPCGLPRTGRPAIKGGRVSSDFATAFSRGSKRNPEG